MSAKQKISNNIPISPPQTGISNGHVRAGSLDTPSESVSSSSPTSSPSNLDVYNVKFTGMQCQEACSTADHSASSYEQLHDKQQLSQEPQASSRESPAQETKGAPTQEAEESQAQELEEVPTQEAEESQTQELEEAPTQEAEESQAQELEEAPTQKAEESQTQELEEAPTQEPEESQAQELEEAPTQEAEGAAPGEILGKLESEEKVNVADSAESEGVLNEELENVNELVDNIQQQVETLTETAEEEHSAQDSQNAVNKSSEQVKTHVQRNSFTKRELADVISQAAQARARRDSSTCEFCIISTERVS